jgi:ATP-dependent DNA helicase RecQ
MGIEPPGRLSSAGLEKTWPAPSNGRCRLPAEVLLLVPADPNFEGGFPHLINTLTGAGIEQIVVPSTHTNTAAHLMVSSTTRLGLVMDEKEWSGNAELARVPSAVLLPNEDWVTESMLDRLIDFNSGGGPTMIVVARPDRVIRGRRLDQTVSRQAPISEELLRSIIADRDPLA